MPEFAASKDGTRIAYWTAGRGRPLVLLHGTMADHTRWDPLRELLEPHATLCAVDRRGYGASGDTHPYAIEREYEDVAAVVNAVARKTGSVVDLFGHSYGAMCALGAARLTTNIRKLVLYEPSVLADAAATGFAERAEALLADGRREEVVELLFREILKLPSEEIARMRSQPSWQVRVANAHALVREDRAEAAFLFDPAQYRTVQVPALLLLGSESPEFFRASTRAVADALPNARIALLEAQQHMAISSAPRLVADAVVPFLAEAAKPPQPAARGEPRGVHGVSGPPSTR